MLGEKNFTSEVKLKGTDIIVIIISHLLSFYRL